jgi:hypothetical protein
MGKKTIIIDRKLNELKMQIINAKIDFENKTEFESLKNIGNCNEKILTFIK